MYYLALASTYSNVEIALFSNNSLIDQISLHKHQSSALLIPYIDELLKQHSLTLDDIEFLAVNSGPGPFTTLRVVIATANGIAYASKKPLVGIDALQALTNEFHSNTAITVALLQAFSGDVYYAIADHDKNIKKGSMNYEAFLSELKEHRPQQNILFIGNGAELYKNEITTSFNKQAQFPEKIPSTCSIETIGQMAYVHFMQHGQRYYQLFPHYLKNMS